MGDKETAEWADLTIVDKRVGAMRAGFAKTLFTLSAKPPAEWTERFGKSVDENPETESLKRNPGPSIDGDVITWEISDDEVTEGWGILKTALDEANEAYGRLDQARRYKESQWQERLDARDKKREELDKTLKSLK